RYYGGCEFADVVENLARVMPAGSRGVIQRDTWPVPPVFGWLARLGAVERDEMERVFNMGLGLVLVVNPYFADSVRSQLVDCGHESWQIGQVVAGPGDVVWG
ncbi:MAG: AIR synthase-related protein, partial [Pirellulales bacterium]